MKQRVPFRRIDAGMTESLLQRPGVLVLDVRDAGSFARGHIDSARNVTMGDLSGFIARTPKDQAVLICCYHGNASREYAQILSDFGFIDVASLDGGYEAWRSWSCAASGSINGALQEWLAARGFPVGDVNAAILNGMTPLMKAAHAGDVAITRELIAAGAMIEARNDDGNTALWLAAAGDSIDVMNILIAAGADVDNQNDNGATVLMYAASAGKAAAVELLLRAGADLTLMTPDDFTALDMAATIECLTFLRHARRR
jgi:rhodanese-related sulfurtransferase